MSNSIFEHQIKLPDGRALDLAQYKGKVLLIVNTATQCGLTPQFEGLEYLHQKYKDQGLVVLGCPCNQFGGQEPLSNDEMVDQCQVNHGVTFQLTEKISVNGSDEHPLFKSLKKGTFSWLGSKIKWNFTKFIVNKEGKVVKRFGPTVKPRSIEPKLGKLLKE